MSPLDRRQFMGRGLAMLGSAGLGALGATAVEQASAADTAPDATMIAREANYDELHGVVPFDGEHQAGILTPPQVQATFAALDSIAPTRLYLQEALQALCTRARELCHGGAYPLRSLDEPPFDSGVLGTDIAPDDLTVTIAFGSSLFDDRYGLANGLPPGLTRMQSFPIDDLDQSQCHGDVMLQICSGQRDTAAHTLRELMRTVMGSLQLRWTVDGFRGARRGPTPHSTPRNLFAFRDGTANPDVTDAALMNRLLWLPAGSGPTAWAAGGTFQVVRLIDMHVEFWDRVGLGEQQRMIGRYRDSGAPLGGTGEFEDPDYASDPEGKRVPTERPHPPCQPAYPSHCRPAPAAPLLQLPARFQLRRPAHAGTRLRRLQPEHPAPVRNDSDTPAGRADDRLHHSRRRRVLLRAAGDHRPRRLGGVGAVCGYGLSKAMLRADLLYSSRAILVPACRIARRGAGDLNERRLQADRPRQAAGDPYPQARPAGLTPGVRCLPASPARRRPEHPADQILEQESRRVAHRVRSRRRHGPVEWERRWSTEETEDSAENMGLAVRAIGLLLYEEHNRSHGDGAQVELAPECD